MPKPVITRREWYWVAFVTAFIFLLTTIPYLVAVFYGPPDAKFIDIYPAVGAPLLDDGQYFALIHGYEHHFLIDDRLTPEHESQGYLFSSFWWLTAQVSVVLHVTPDISLHILRFLAAGLFAFVVYRTIALFLEDPADRRMAFWWTILAPSLIWVSMILSALNLLKGERIPITEQASPFIGIAGRPTHLLVATGVAFVIYCLMRGIATKQRRFAIYAALAIGGTVSFHPYEWPVYMMISFAVLGLAFYFERAAWWIWLQSAALIFFLPLPIFLYWAAIPKLSTQFASVVSHNYAPVVSPFGLFFIFGLPFPLAWLYYSGFRRPKEDNWRNLTLSIWLIVTIACAYTPFFPWGWHLLNGLVICLAISTTLVLRPLIDRLWLHWFPRMFAKTTIFILTAMPVIVISLIAVTTALKNKPGDYLYLYLNKDEQKSYAWLDQRCGDDPVMLQLHDGAMLGITTSCRPWIQHPILTLDFETRRNQSQDIFNGTMPTAETLQLLHANHIHYLFADSVNQTKGLSPQTKAALREVSNTPTVTIYEIP